jgi:hypothetical protein
MPTINSIEAGKILGVSNARVTELARFGRLPHTNKVKKGAKRIVWKFDKAVVEEYAHGKKPIETRVEEVLKQKVTPAPRKKNGQSRLERIEAKLDRLLEILC